MRQLLWEIRTFGIGVAWYNIKWRFCYWWLGAKHMKVVRKR